MADTVGSFLYSYLALNVFGVMDRYTETGFKVTHTNAPVYVSVMLGNAERQSISQVVQFNASGMAQPGDELPTFRIYYVYWLS